MKQLMHVYAKTAQELCKMINDMGVEPMAILPAGANQRVVAYYYAKPESPKPAAKSEKVEAPMEEAGEAKKAESPKPAATRAKK
jgi:hypothetical protein